MAISEVSVRRMPEKVLNYNYLPTSAILGRSWPFGNQYLFKNSNHEIHTFNYA